MSVTTSKKALLAKEQTIKDTKKHHKSKTGVKGDNVKAVKKDDSKLYLDDMQDLKYSRLIFCDTVKNQRAMKPFMPRAKSSQTFRPDITGNRDSDFRSQNALFIPALINIEKEQVTQKRQRVRDPSKKVPQKEQDHIRMMSVLNSKAREQRLKQLNIKNQQL